MRAKVDSAAQDINSNSNGRIVWRFGVELISRFVVMSRVCPGIVQRRVKLIDIRLINGYRPRSKSGFEGPSHMIGLECGEERIEQSIFVRLAMRRKPFDQGHVERRPRHLNHCQNCNASPAP